MRDLETILVIEPIVAFKRVRKYYDNRLESGFADDLFRPYFRSDMGIQKLGRIHEAECPDYAHSRHKMLTKDSIVPHLWNNVSTSIPTLITGFYGYKLEKDAVGEYSFYDESNPAIVVVEVEFSGRVIEYERGYVAQYQKIVDIVDVEGRYVL